jgi:hypothetical protein
MREQIEQPSRTPWRIAAIAGLIAAAAGPLLVMALDQAIAPVGLIFVAILVAMAGLVLTGNRWLIAIVVLVAGLYLVSAIRSPIVEARLADPAALGYFAVAALEVAGSAVATLASLVALDRSASPRIAR